MGLHRGDACERMARVILFYSRSDLEWRFTGEFYWELSQLEYSS